MSLWQRVFSTARNDSPIKDRSVLDLRIGDTISHDLMDYLVIGQVTYYDESGFTWTDYQLEGDGDTWLVFEKEIDLAAIYKPVDLNLTGNPPKEIKYQGIVYSLCEFGKARVIEVNNQRVNSRRSSIKYWQYQDYSGGNVMYAEDRNGKLEISCGYCIRPHELGLIRKLRAIY